MDKYGLTDNEKLTNLHNYNHALFRNMMFFMNIVWEVNMITKTVVVLEDKNEPDRNGKEIEYQDLFYDYLDKYIEETEKEIFDRYLRFERLEELKAEISFDIHLRVRESSSELHNVVLTPAFDEDGILYCVYLGARNIQAEIRREMEEYHRQKQFLNALLSNSYLHFSVDLSGDGIIHESCVTKDGHDLIREFGLDGEPVSFSRFIGRWFDVCEPQFDSEERKQMFDAKALKELYRNNEHLIELEVKQKSLDGSDIANIMQVFIVLMSQPEDKHIRAYMIWTDVSLFQRKTFEDNKELRSLNEDLRNTLGQEQQYRLASLAGALLVYNINLTRNLIEEEFYEIVDDQRIPMLQLVGLEPPCNFDEFCRRWCATKVSVESKETFLRMFNREYMLDAYQRGERHLEIEFDTVLGRGIPITLRNTAFLVEDRADGDILAVVNSKDVSEQRAEEKRQREKLRNAYEAANTASEAKTDFLERMSHDIRTPMNAIIGMTAIASSHLNDTKRVEECLKEISGSGKYLLTILTEVLDMSRIEAGKFELFPKEFDLTAILDNLSVICKFQSKAREHEFEMDIRPIKHPKVTGDYQRLQQALMSLVDNAIKFTPDGGRIKFTVSELPAQEPGTVRFEFVVRDNGIGMEPEYLERLFEPFVRSEDERVSKIQGIGLGLPIAGKIVGMMGGEIAVESELNKGTTVTVRVALRIRESV